MSQLARPSLGSLKLRVEIEIFKREPTHKTSYCSKINRTPSADICWICHFVIFTKYGVQNMVIWQKGLLFWNNDQYYKKMMFFYNFYLIWFFRIKMVSEMKCASSTFGFLLIAQQMVNKKTICPLHQHDHFDQRPHTCRHHRRHHQRHHNHLFSMHHHHPLSTSSSSLSSSSIESTKFRLYPSASHLAIRIRIVRQQQCSAGILRWSWLYEKISWLIIWKKYHD